MYYATKLVDDDAPLRVHDRPHKALDFEMEQKDSNSTLSLVNVRRGLSVDELIDIVLAHALERLLAHSHPVKLLLELRPLIGFEVEVILAVDELHEPGRAHVRVLPQQLGSGALDLIAHIARGLREVFPL